MKDSRDILLNGLTIFVVILLVYILNDTITDIKVEKIEEKAEYNKCVRILINEDEIENGCDKYFLDDKWYNDFMEQMFDEYEKIK